MHTLLAPLARMAFTTCVYPKIPIEVDEIIEIPLSTSTPNGRFGGNDPPCNINEYAVAVLTEPLISRYGSLKISNSTAAFVIPGYGEGLFVPKVCAMDIQKDRSVLVFINSDLPVGVSK